MNITSELLATATNTLATACHAANRNWWIDLRTGGTLQNNPLCFSNKLMMVVTELAEACEGDRKNLPDDKLPHRSMREVELADALIRIFDLAGAYGMDIGGALAEKMEYNASRADHKLLNRAAAGGKAY